MSYPSFLAGVIATLGVIYVITDRAVKQMLEFEGH
jgi:hypothetical protein